jgi:hypothetical protein
MSKPLHRIYTPHSLGKLIEWKRYACSTLPCTAEYTPPHSLGKLIEWKRNRFVAIALGFPVSAISPHSLGKLIEWKPSHGIYQGLYLVLPARWGN